MRSDIVQGVHLVDDLVVKGNYILALDVFGLVGFEKEKLIADDKQTVENRLFLLIYRRAEGGRVGHDGEPVLLCPGA